ncbi:MAG: glycoside hydrolase family 88 protein [Candidatus Marinimicrobia bacterium]|nr:glycoside hydrolase family 88 protein [Candidatus Neomarinimicrobiota bacterium]
MNMKIICNFRIPILGILSIFLSGGCCLIGNKSVVKRIEHQLVKKDNIFIQAGMYPEFTVDGKWTFSMDQRPNWFAGFTGGELWLVYEMTGNDNLQRRAIAHADHLLEYSSLDNTHDMGFIFLPTCVKAYLKTGDIKYRQAGIEAAEMLAKRFNKNGKFIRAWGRLETSRREGWMIIDTMMNLELLFWAAQETGVDSLYEIANAHAQTAMREIVRKNYSSYHVIEWDPQTGEIIEKRTHQGYAPESTWARGQAWGLYGFANTFRRTGNKDFLKTSIGMADYFIDHLPSDLVPFWDLDLAGEDVLKDASAGAIAASGMFLLAEVVDDENLKNKYRSFAENISQSLIENYLFTQSQREREEGILLHTIYNFNKGNGVDESYPCGDYYFTEAVWKLWALKGNDL